MQMQIQILEIPSSSIILHDILTHAYETDIVLDYRFLLSSQLSKFTSMCSKSNDTDSNCQSL